MKNKTLNKISSTLLTAFLVLTMVSLNFTVAEAAEYQATLTTAGGTSTNYDTLEEAVAEAMKNDGSVVTLNERVTLDGQLIMQSFFTANSLTIDLNGFSVSAESTVFHVGGKTTLTVKDSKGTGSVNGLINLNNTAQVYLVGVKVIGVSTGVSLKSADAMLIADKNSSITVTNSFGKAIDLEGNVKIDGILKGGSREILYKNGTIDLSTNPDPDGIRIAPSSANYPLKMADVKLPDGYYCFDVNGKLLESTASSTDLVTVKKLIKYSVSFDANGGNGTMAVQTFTNNVSQNLTANTFTRTGYKFIGWNTAADGSGTAYSDGEEITVSDSITLYAQWTRKLELMINGINIVEDSDHSIALGNGSATYDPATKTLTLKDAEITAPGYAFNGISYGIYICYFDEKVTINLEGKNTLTLTDPNWNSNGIWVNPKAGLAITGTGSLDITLQNTGNYPYGIFSSGPVEITDAEIAFSLTEDSTGNGAVIDVRNDNGIVCDNAKITATGFELGMIADGEVVIKNESEINIVSGDVALASFEMDVSFENSTVIVIAEWDYCNAIYCEGDLSIDSSTVTATSTYPGIYSYGALDIKNSKIKATSTDDYAVWATGDLSVSEKSEVICNGCIGGIGSSTGFTVEDSKIDATGGDYGIYSYNFMDIISGEVTAKGSSDAVYIVQISDNADLTVEPDSLPNLILINENYAEIHGFEIHASDWNIIGTDYDDEVWAAEEWFVDSDGNRVTDVTIRIKPADYSAVDEAIAKADALNKDDYSDFSAVENAINAVDRSKNITEQDEVDAMAEAIFNAIDTVIKAKNQMSVEAVGIELEKFDINRVTIFWEDEIEALKAKIEELLADENMGEAEIEKLNEYKAQADKLIEVINDPVEYFSLRLFYFIWDCLTWKNNSIVNIFKLIFT